MENFKSKKPIFVLWEVIVIAFGASLIMSVITGYIVYRNKAFVDCSAVVDNAHIGEFINSYNSILNNYYAEVEESDLIDAAINGMMTYLSDPYTTYLNEGGTEYLLDSLKGTYEGIGIQITALETGLIAIMTVFDDTPAAQSGILVGDIVKAINGASTSEKSAEEVVAMIKGSNDQEITIDIDRNGESLSFSLIKTTLYIPVIKSQILNYNNQKVGYINVERFSETVGEQFSIKLNELEKQSINSLIIDLRNNTGGYLQGAIDISSMFLKEGALIYSLKSKLETIKEKVITPEERNYKVYVLMNSATASASEIVASALKYSYLPGTLLIGETSYGKGKVQQTSKISSGSMLKYTTAEWLTPNGDCIDGIGLKPDVEVSLSDEYYESPSMENDNQLQTAIFEITK